MRIGTIAGRSKVWQQTPVVQYLSKEKLEKTDSAKPKTDGKKRAAKSSTLWRQQRLRDDWQAQKKRDWNNEVWRGEILSFFQK